MTTTLAFELDLEEVAPVRRFLGESPPAELESDGVWLHTSNGRRVWTCGSWALAWEVTGGPTDDAVTPVCLPGRLLWHAAELADEAKAPVNISLPEGLVAVADSPVGTLVIDLPVGPERPHFPSHTAVAATAKLTSRHLYAALTRALHRPVGPDPSQQLPPVILGIADGQVATTVNWAEVGGFRSTFRQPAATVGRATCRVPALELRDLLGAVDPDEELTITVPEQADVPLVVQGEGWRAAVSRRETGSRRFHDELGQALADAVDGPCRTLARGVFTARRGQRRLRAELHDEPAELVRLTTVVLPDAQSTPALLEQVNAANAALAGARLWVAEDCVVAGLDLPCAHIDELRAQLDLLDRQLSGYDTYLSAFVEEQ